MGHSMSLAITPFERSHTNSYWRSIVTMTLSCIISEIKRDINRKCYFHTSPAFDAPVRAPRRNIAMTIT